MKPGDAALTILQIRSRLLPPPAYHTFMNCAIFGFDRKNLNPGTMPHNSPSYDGRRRLTLRFISCFHIHLLITRNLDPHFVSRN